MVVMGVTNQDLIGFGYDRSDGLLVGCQATKCSLPQRRAGDEWVQNDSSVWRLQNETSGPKKSKNKV